MKELQRHIDAFEIYFKKKQEGNDTAKAITLASQECNFSETSLYTWKKEFDWDDREAIRAAEINKKVEEKTDSTIIENKTKYLSFYHKLLDKLKKDGFNIDIKSPRDLDLVVKGALLLQGEHTEHKVRLEATQEVKLDITNPDFMDAELEFADKLINRRLGGTTD
jgi:hypothetical protein